VIKEATVKVIRIAAMPCSQVLSPNSSIIGCSEATTVLFTALWDKSSAAKRLFAGAKSNNQKKAEEAVKKLLSKSRKKNIEASIIGNSSHTCKPPAVRKHNLTKHND
jgi:hypothetical protein